MRRLLLILLLPLVMGATWYVSQDGAGTKDGKSYGNREEGLENILWDADGITGPGPGDTLYVCGLNVHNVIGTGNMNSQADIVPVSGTSDSARVTIRGDYAGDPGFVYGTAYWTFEAWNNVEGDVWNITLPGNFGSRPMEDVTATTFTVQDKMATITGTLTGTWTFTDTSKTVEALGDDGDAQTELDDGDFIQLSTGGDFYEVDGEPADSDTILLIKAFDGTTGADVANSTASQDLSTNITALDGEPGHYYSPTYDYSDELYVHHTEGSDPTATVTIGKFGYQFRMDDLEYITFLNITLRGFERLIELTKSADYITWDGCTLDWGKTLYIPPDSDNIIVDSCEISNSANGIYTTAGPAQAAPINYIFRNNYIHDIANDPQQYNGDAHGIGIQGGTNGLIEGNYIVRAGNAILLYTYSLQDLTNTIIRYNHIKDCHTSGGEASGNAISLQVSNTSITDKVGNKIYGNLVDNPVGYGIRCNFEDEVEIYNNTLYACKYGIGSTRSVQIIEFDNGTYTFQKNDEITDGGAKSAKIGGYENISGTTPNITGTLAIEDVVGEWADDDNIEIGGDKKAEVNGATYKLGANIIAKNNIIMNSGTCNVIFANPNTIVTVDFDYNMYNTDGATLFDYGGTDYNLAGWRGISDGANIFDPSIAAIDDPELRDVTRGKFTPLDGSPVIGAGVDVGLKRGRRGGSTADPPDIGSDNSGPVYLLF